MNRASRGTWRLIGSSAAMVELRELIARLVGSDATLVIQGESGSGKEVVARLLHSRSPRGNAPFVPINCGAIPPDLLESELFGHRRGAFTGALADRRGRFEMAHGGTLFLDEIGDMPLPMQVKLLRVLQERYVEPVGAAQGFPVDVRVIAATHRDLEAEVAAGRFREDLFFRLNVIPVRVPPLRERIEDLPELIRFFSRAYAPVEQNPTRFEECVLQRLRRYDWPGNVRELGNLVQRFTVLFPGESISFHRVPGHLWPQRLRELQGARAQRVVETESTAREGEELLEEAEGASMDPPLDPVTESVMLAQGWSELLPQGLDLRGHLAGVETRIIERALELSRGNVSGAARLLKIRRTTLSEKISKYGIGTTHY